MRSIWTTVRELEEMPQETRNNLAVNFGRRIVPLRDIDLNIFSRGHSFPIVRMSVFDEAEKKYLSALLNIVNVTRDKGTKVSILKFLRYNKKTNKEDRFEIWISFKYNHELQDIILPQFSVDKNYYRGMVANKSYNLEEELSLPARDTCN